MRNLAMAWPLVVCLALLSGCAEVIVKEPFGTPLDADLEKQLLGDWVTEEGPALSVVRTGPNEWRAAMMEWNAEKAAFEVDQRRIELRLIHNTIYLFCRNVEPQADPQWLFCKVERPDPDTVHLYYIDDDLIRPAITQGVLKGEVIKVKPGETKIVLHATADQMIKFLAENPKLYFDEPSFVIRKSKRAFSPASKPPAQP